MSKYFANAQVEAFKRRDTGGRRMDAVYASDASIELDLGGEKKVYGTCLRKQFYRITEVPQSDPDGPGETFVTGVGEAVHEQIARVFSAAEQLVGAEIRVWIDSVKLSGRIDAIIRPGDTRVGVEVKSIGGYHNIVGPIRGTSKVPFAPKIGHLCQTVVYAQHMYEQTQGEMTEWIIIYVDRETGHYAEHNIRYISKDEIWVNGEPSSVTPARIYARWDTLWQYIGSQTKPPRDYEMQYSKEKLQHLADIGRLNKKDTQTVNSGRLVDKGDQECRWCPWSTACWTEEASTS